MKITLVKKILRSGSACRKCIEVQNKLEESGQLDRIDQILEAREDDPQSPGMLLAQQYEVDRAPFFIVEEEGKPARVYTVYMKFVAEVLEA
ncbi:hypothetical protein [Gilvimarinus sp. DA14]|uniref:hypothetical protein n=1 Tax=Gilvimarinus sp. DA14 TaxID=2956798 RepID=UPI0020B6FF55|nr:hypothetical protein [Gilvimarinus sp. DA14]UTF60590.1 hypothetical protein NHM04_01995 [Gilvimarinus sp. DA14]